MLHLVNCEVTESYYMSKSKKYEMNHIVEAENDEMAMDKVTNHYQKMDNEYCVTYYVNFHYCNKIIV